MSSSQSPMPLDYSVETAAFHDLVDIRDTHQAVIREQGGDCYGPEIMQIWRRDRPITPYHQAYARGETYFIARSAEDAALLGFSSHVEEKGKHWLKRLFVRKAAGRQGIGTALLKAVETQALAKNASELHVEGTLNGESFYLKAGFQLLERTKSLVGNSKTVTMDCLLMVKRL